MKKTNFLITLILPAFSLLQAYSLKVNVDNLHNSKGVVQVSLYNKSGSIPDKKYTKYFKKKSAKINNKKAYVVFNNLPKGLYALNVLHDENNNGKIDKGFILPKEGIGFSNFKTLNIANKPNFKKASFMLNRDSSVNINVIYF